MHMPKQIKHIQIYMTFKVREKVCCVQSFHFIAYTHLHRVP